MVHSSISKPQVITSVLTSGYAGNLAKGQLAFVKDKAVKGKGAEIVSDFKGMNKKERIAIRVGEMTTPNGLRTVEVSSKGTGMFSLDSVLDIKAYIPTQTNLIVDHLEVGYDGINDSTALYIPEGKSAIFDISIYGEVASTFFGKSDFVISKEVYREKGETMQEAIRRVVKELKEEKVPTTTGFASVTDELAQFLEIGIIDSSTPALAGTDWEFSSIIVEDKGESNDLAAVQASYPSNVVKRTSYNDGKSTYTILHLASQTIADLVLSDASVVNKGCGPCPAGYSTLTGGYVYSISLEDDGVTQVAKIQALPGALAGTATRVGSSAGLGTYFVVLDNALTNAEKATFLATDAITATTSFTDLGTVENACKATSSQTYVWVAGEICKSSTRTFSIMLPDNECGASRLTELQKVYPDLVISAGAGVGGCKRTYTTTVVTNMVCEECDDIFLQPFYAEAPDTFEGVAWEEVIPAFDPAAKMGIFVKGKPFYIYPQAHEEDFVPYVETSLKVKSMSFGSKGSLLLNYDGSPYDPDTEFASARKLQYAQDVNNNAVALFGAERMGNIHFANKPVHKKNLFARANLSQERLLEYDKKYVQYAIKYKDSTLSQMGGSRSDITHEFRIIVQYGKHQALQGVLNNLAGKLGLDAVNVIF
jgi:hypothetical protein